MVFKKLMLLLLFPALLAGCGASTASDEAEMCQSYGMSPAGGQAYSETTVSDSFRSPGSGRSEDPDEDGASTSQIHYVVFSRSSATTTAEDGTELLYESDCEGTFDAYDPELGAWVNSVLDEIHQQYDSRSENLKQYASDSLREIGKDAFYSYSNYQDMGVTRHDEKILSLVVLSSVYSGGSHPNSIQTAWNLDLESRTVLTLADVLCPDGEKALSELVLSHVEEKFSNLGQNVLFADYAETIAASFRAETLTPYWYFNDNGLVIFFNQYELGPYAAGIIKTEIPYEELHGTLRDEFFPEHLTLAQGKLLVYTDWNGLNPVFVTDGSANGKIILGTDGQLHRIRLSALYLAGQTVVGQKVLFSANLLTASDVLVLTAGFGDGQTVYAVEFLNASGTKEIWYVHPEGLSQKP